MEREIMRIMMMAMRIMVGAVTWIFRLLVRLTLVTSDYLAGWWVGRKQEDNMPSYVYISSGTHGTARFGDPRKYGLTGNDSGFIIGLID